MGNTANSHNSLDKNTSSSKNKTNSIVSNAKSHVNQVFSSIKTGLEKRSDTIGLIKYALSPKKRLELIQRSYKAFEKVINNIPQVLSKEGELFQLVLKDHDANYANNFIKSWKSSLEWIEGSMFYLEKAYKEYNTSHSSGRDIAEKFDRTSVYIDNYLEIVEPYKALVGRDILIGR